MRGRAETRKIIEVRVRSKLWSVLAMEGKALVFGPALNQKLKQPTYRTRGLEECGFIDSETKSTVFLLDPVAFLPRWKCLKEMETVR